MESAGEFQNVYANAFRSEFGSVDYPTKLNLRSDGYPKELSFGQAAQSKLVDKIGLTIDKGDYVLTYEGEGFVEIIFDVGMIRSQRKVNYQNHLYIFFLI
jgi:hypothetical protein